MIRRLEGDYFDALYESSEDPWDFERSPYEREKYERTLAALGPRERRFARGLECGCSIGVLTAMLADRCDELVAVDVSESAVKRAHRRLIAHPNVTVLRRTLPEEMPGGPWDLIVCSEILYYWSEELLVEAFGAMRRELASGGSILAVHWRPATRTYPLGGDEVHELLADNLDLEHAVSSTEPLYRLDRYDARS